MIKVTVGEQKTQEEVPFPKLMKYNPKGPVILFNSKGCGTVIVKGESGVFDYSLGVYKIDWITENFDDYNLPVTLQNILP